ncbi:MAG: hypothetical protein WCK67_01235 [bacterium]
MKKVFNLIIIIFACLSVAGCDFNSASTDETLNKADMPTMMANNQNEAKQPAFNFEDARNYDNDEEKVIEVTNSNIGRKDPFKPFNEKIISSLKGNNSSNNDALILPPSTNPLILNDDKSLNGVPLPPSYDADSPLIKMMKIRIGGILYDTQGSSAILNVDGDDYVVHEGDKIFDFRVKEITPDKVAIACGKNIYKKGVGEMFTGKLNSSPVKGVNNMYAGKKRNSTLEKLPDIRFVSPTTYL